MAFENYVREIHESLRSHFATWLPDASLKIGDYGSFRSGIFDRIGNISDLGFCPELDSRVAKNSFYEYRSKGSVEVRQFLKGEVKAPEMLSGAAGLEINFSSSNAIFFNASGCGASSLKNNAELHRFLAERQIENQWRYSHVVITELVHCKKLVVLIATDSTASVLLKAEANAPELDLASIQMDFGVSRERGVGLKIVTTSGAGSRAENSLTPLYKLHRLHWKLLGPEIRAMNLSSKEVDLEQITSAQVATLANRGRLKQEDFELNELP